MKTERRFDPSRGGTANLPGALIKVAVVAEIEACTRRDTSDDYIRQLLIERLFVCLLHDQRVVGRLAGRLAGQRARPKFGHPTAQPPYEPARLLACLLACLLPCLAATRSDSEVRLKPQS